MHQTLVTGNTLAILQPFQKLFILESKTAARDVQLRLKEIDGKLDGIRLELYREAFGDGTLGLTDQDLVG